MQGEPHLKQQFLEGSQVAVAGRERLTASPWVLPYRPEPTTTNEHTSRSRLMLKHSVGMPGLPNYLHALMRRQRKPWRCYVMDNMAIELSLMQEASKVFSHHHLL